MSVSDMESWIGQAKGGIECSMTVDDENGICTIYSPGIELADDSERINKSFEDMLEEVNAK